MDSEGSPGGSQRSSGGAMKTYRIKLTAEEQKKLEQVLKRLKQRDVQSYFLSVLQEHWLRLS
jgi:hypothetical protein